MSQPDPQLHDSPDPGQLVEAVRTFLEEDVLDATDGQVHFLTRVAANVLRIVERQLALAPTQEAAYAARLRDLGYASDAELVDAIRAGKTDRDYREILATLRQAVWDKVMVVNPRYVAGARDPFDGTSEPPIVL
jgi:multidrug efflux pump subunit AcrA (membrane-fusion protein)